PRGELEEPYQLTFGKDGKPFFVAGPRDNAARIVKQLEKTAGPGNFDYVAMLGAL
ncbi:MAG TPA: helix-turn-helix domain containing protein, partial [Ktedonobacter sp.]|nr:helix-turn-helix domain containing protein [Ktedonobacter sp.]